jgi:hypothetical protein
MSRVVTTYQKSESIIVSDSCEPRIVTGQDLYGLTGTYLGTIKIDEAFLYITGSSCSQEAAFKRLKTDACNLKANLINITSEIKPREEVRPYHVSACYRCIADYYFIEFDTLVNKIFARGERDIINYTSDYKLKWDDFMVVLPDSSEMPYEFVSKFFLVSGKMSAWTGVYSEFEVNGMFISDISKVKKSFANETNEKTIGLLFDLTQVYARKLEMFLNSHKPKLANMEKIKSIYNSYHNLLKAEIRNFNKETDFGRNTFAYQQWEDRINKEAINLGIKK